MCTMLPFIGIIAILFLMTVIFKLEAKQTDLELAKTRLSGELELRKDGLYIGDVKIDGVTKYTIEPNDGSFYKVNLELVVLNKNWYESKDEQ